MNTLKQTLKAVIWGVTLLTSILITTGGVAATYLHVSSVRDSDKVSQQAKELYQDVANRVAVLREESEKYSSLAFAERYAASDDRDVAKYPIYSRIVAEENALADQLDAFCSDNNFGCYFRFVDEKYKFYSEINLTDDAFLGNVQAMAAWGKDLEEFFLRQSDPATVKSENWRRTQSVLGSAALTLLGMYFLFALAQFKKLSFFKYTIITTVSVPALLIALYGATTYVHPADGMLTPSFSSFYQSFMLVTLILYPFLVLPPVYMALQKRQMKLISIMMFWKDRESTDTT